MGVHHYGWFILENPNLKWMILGVPIHGNPDMGVMNFIIKQSYLL